MDSKNRIHNSKEEEKTVVRPTILKGLVIGNSNYPVPITDKNGEDIYLEELPNCINDVTAVAKLLKEKLCF